MRLLLLLAVLLLGAALTRPSEDRAADLLLQRLQAEIASGTLPADADAAQRVALRLCQAAQPACAQLIGAGVRMGYDDWRVAARVPVRAFGRETTCLAVATRLVCGGDLQG
ncbi:MAG: hypothetical protein ACU0BF_00015 [Paracoccaceae bacterium]